MTYHFIGIGGIGMSGLARMLIERGKKVTGSDASSSYVTDGLAQIGAKIFIGHAKDHVPDGATVIYNSDIPKDNPELQLAREKNYPLMHRSDLLLKLMQDHRILAVAGTHGKTTTTSLLTHLFLTAKLDPSFAVGGMLAGYDVNARGGRSDYFLVEADESDGTFLKYPYNAAIVTNIDNDHLAHFGTWDNLVASFNTFIEKAPAPVRLFYCLDDPTLASMQLAGTSYGFSKDADLGISNFRANGWQITFDLEVAGRSYKDIICNLTGRHNALNAAAVFGMGLLFGIDEATIRLAFASFAGVKRRLEKKGECGGMLVFDDYAHHPTEIRATLKALRGAAPKSKIIAVFQPHRYSRMRYVMKDFDHVFEDADVVVLTDLFTAKEMPVEGVTTEAILEEIQKSCKVCQYIPRDALVNELASFASEASVMVTLGAGDITKVGKQLVESWK